MKCEDFESIGLDTGRDTTLSELERAAAREHASTCPRCAALQDSWQVASAELRFFSDATRIAQVAPRVELRLRQEFRTQHRTLKMRRAAVVTTWALAAAAVLVAAVSWYNWHESQRLAAAKHSSPPQIVPSSRQTGENSGATTAPDNALVADNDLSDFTLLPGSLPLPNDDSAIVRVRMQRSSLTALGLPVNEEGAGDWIQVDLLVGNDGLPEAVRLLQE
jgi:hypothetical protein